jgi:hypothetical protein
MIVPSTLPFLFCTHSSSDQGIAEEGEGVEREKLEKEGDDE